MRANRRIESRRLIGQLTSAFTAPDEQQDAWPRGIIGWLLHSEPDAGHISFGRPAAKSDGTALVSSSAE
jgi:hypothetical protein